MSFVCLGLFTTEFVGQFAIEGLQPSRTPAFAEPNVFEAFGVVMFTYAFIVTVPSWVNEKKPQVSVKKVMWTSALTCSLLQLAFGLLGAWADFGQEDPESWARYDDVTAEELFVARGGCSDALYEDMVSPLLHVLPMGPGYDISAAAALSCFHVFALQVSSCGSGLIDSCRPKLASLAWASPGVG